MLNNKPHTKCYTQLALKGIGFIAIATIALCIILSALSCNTSKVHRSIEKVKTDSLNVRKVFEQKADNVDSISDAGSDITILKKEETDYDNETVIEYFEPNGVQMDTIEDSSDSTVQILHSAQPIKKITIRSKGKSSSVDSSHAIDYANLNYAKNENSSKIEEDSGHLVTESKTVNVDKKKSKVPVAGIIGVVLLLALIIFLKVKK